MDSKKKSKGKRERSFSNVVAHSSEDSSKISYLELQKANEVHEQNHLLKKLRKKTIQEMLIKLEELIIKEKNGEFSNNKDI